MLKLKTNKYLWLMITLLGTILIVLLPYFCRGNYLAWIGNIKERDGITQHATFLHYFKESGLILGSYDFKIGLGADYFVSFIYYLILDPFNIFLYIFPFSNFLLTYSIVIILKYLTCGLFMFLYLQHKKIRTSLSIVISSIYMISGFVLFTLPRHPDLTGGVIFLPLIIYGIELLFENKRPYLLIVSTFLCFISSFYMFYMVSIFVVIYTILYYFEMNRQNKTFLSFIKQVGKVAFWYAVAILLASFMLLPLLYGFIHSARSGSKGIGYFDIFYYLSIIFSPLLPLLTTSHYTPIMTNPIMLICLVPFFFIKGNKTYKISLIILTCGLFIPFFGYIMNFFNYSNNRWLFLLDFVMCMCMAFSLNYYLEHHQIKEEKKAKQFFIRYVTQQKIVSILFVVTLVYANFANIFYSKEFDNGDTWNSLYTTQEKEVSHLQNQDKDFFRTDKENNPQYMYNYVNKPINNLYNGTYQYNTISNEYIFEFLKSIGMYNSNHTLGISGLNQRIAIQSLLSIKYYISENQDHIPYHYEKVNENLYQNSYYLPMGIFYPQKMSEKQFYSLPLEERQVALMENIIVDSNLINEKEYLNKTISLNGIQPEKSIEIEILKNNKVNVLKDNASLTFHVPNVINSELYFNILDFTTTTKQTITIESKKAYYMQTIVSKGQQMYSGIHDYSFNLGYYENEDVEVTITFLKKGVYNLQNYSFSIYKMNDFVAQYENLKSAHHFEYAHNSFKGKMNQDVSGALFFSIPYSKGWKAKIDSKPAALYKANIGFLGLDVEEGEHIIELFYETPYLHQGKIVTFITIIFLMSYITYDIIKSCSKRKKEI